MMRIAENILRKNWRFASGNAGIRPIKETEIPGGFRIENVNQTKLSGYLYPQYQNAPVNPFPIRVSMTLKCSINGSVLVTIEGTPIASYFDLVAQEAVEVLIAGTVSGSSGRLVVSLTINDLPVGEWLEITDPHFFLSTEKPDIWTPAHADLTSEQIAKLPPYGEYKEIKSF